MCEAKASRDFLLSAWTVFAVATADVMQKGMRICQASKEPFKCEFLHQMLFAATSTD